MGRAERRRMERQNRIEDNKGKVLMSQHDINELRRSIVEDVADFRTEALMTCFALANRRLYGHGTQRTLRTLQYIDELMGHINTGEKTIDDYKRELEDEINVRVVCRN